jgi:chromosome segregation ATPase
MSHTANLTSIDALASLQATLRQFSAKVRDAALQIDLAARRPLDWIEHDRSQYWPRELRKAVDAVSEARLTLARAQATIDPHDHRSCYDERKQLDKAKRRLELSESKVAAVRRWKIELRKEVEELEMHSAKLQHFLDGDLERAIADLGRLTDALDRYLQPSPVSPVETASAADAP